MNRVQRGFLIGLLAVVVIDVVVAEALVVSQGGGLLSTCRNVVLATAILFFAGGVLLAGGSRVFPIEEGVENSPMFTTPNFGRILRQDRAEQVRGVSDVPLVGVLYGAVLLVVALFLFLLPA